MLDAYEKLIKDTDELITFLRNNAGDEGAKVEIICDSSESANYIAALLGRIEKDIEVIK